MPTSFFLGQAAPDPLRTEILDRSGADFATASTDAAARTDRVEYVGYKIANITIDVTTLGSITELNIIFRTSGKSNPLVATAADWAAIRSNNLDATTGTDDSQIYTAKIAVSATGSYTLRYPVSGYAFISALVWADAAGGRGSVYIQRGV